jgi:transcriptional regulator with XRE-family HTH domain
MAQSRGGQRFATAVKRQGGYRRMATLLGCSIVTIHYWISGKRRPSADNLRLLERHLSIPVEAWFQPARAPRVARVRAETPAAVEAA